MVAASSAVFGWRLDAASPWRDELVTLEVARRPVSDILRLAADVDLVHVCYYLLVHPVVVALGTVEAVRVVSAVSMAGTAGLVLLIGRRLAGTATGVAAGLLLTVSPMASRFAQEARPAAVVTLVVTAGTVTLLTALHGGGRRRWGGSRIRPSGSMLAI